jgi:hypothetical protein
MHKFELCLCWLNLAVTRLQFEFIRIVRALTIQPVPVEHACPRNVDSTDIFRRATYSFRYTCQEDCHDFERKAEGRNLSEFTGYPSIQLSKPSWASYVHSRSSPTCRPVLKTRGTSRFSAPTLHRWLRRFLHRPELAVASGEPTVESAQ